MAALAIINPRRRGGKKRKAGHKATRRHNPTARKAKRRMKRPTKVAARRAARVLRRRRKNPAGLSGSALKNMIVPAVVGAAGAVGLDYLLNMDAVQAKLPESLKSGWGATALKVGAAVGIGMVLGKVKAVSPTTRNSLVGGMLVVTAYDAISEQVSKMGGGTAAVNGYEAGNLALHGYQPGNIGLGYAGSAPITGDTMRSRSYV